MSDPWQWIHDEVGLSWDDVNAIAAVLSDEFDNHIPAHPGGRTATVTADSAAIPPSYPRAGDPPSGAGRTIEADLLLNLVEQRIGELWRARAWWRANRWNLTGQPEPLFEAADNRRELRTLVGLLRKARKDAMRVPDEITQWKGSVNR